MAHPRLSVQRTLKIEVNFTARDWELYEPDALFTASASDALNRQLKACVNAGATKGETLATMHAQMCLFDDAGATDSEPVAFLERVLDEIYGDE
jgi:hypothetical protein